jgi:putative acyl-CoA dehydrogenase
VNLYSSDRVLKETIAREAPEIEVARIREFGAFIGSGETWEMAAAMHRHVPELHVWDRYGRRVDEVGYHPAYHAMMARVLSTGISAAPWRNQKSGHTLHAVLEFLLAKVEPSVCCPITMTYAAPAALKFAPEVAHEWVPRICTAEYDPSPIPAAIKHGVTIGMAMTEKQGGSDLRANTTRAEPLGEGWYRLNGHKWFCSAPMSDAFLTLAQTPAGLTCFLVARFRRDLRRNGMHIMRLKDKLGDRANASSEIEYNDAEAVIIGEEGRGIRTLLEMVHHTRLDRSAFGRKLIEQPLMRRVLADLAVEAEAATLLAFRLARSFDEMEGNDSARVFSRIATPVAKYWLNKRVVGHVAECMECHGGGGYVEEWPIARFYRQAPLNGIWEGSGNVICLDVIRAFARNPEAQSVLLDELSLARGASARFDRRLDDAARRLQQPEDADARSLTESLAVLLQAALMIRHAPAADSDLFCALRLGEDVALTYGAAREQGEIGPIIERAMPAA